MTRIYQAAYYQLHRERILTAVKKYYSTHKKERNLYRKGWYAENKVRQRAYQDKYRLQHREKYLALQRASQKKTRDTPKSRFNHYKAHAGSRGRSFSLSMEQFMALWRQPCFYCGADIRTIGIDRVDNLRGYEIGNVVSCCANCNRAKRALSKDAFISLCVRVALKHGGSYGRG